MPDNILLTVDERFVQHAGVMLTSLFTNNPERSFRIFIIREADTDISPLLQTIETFKHTAQPLVINSELLSRFKITLHASPANYYRIFLGELLPADLEKVLYLDADMIVAGQISNLLDTPMNDQIIAAVAEPGMSAEKKRDLGLLPGQEYFNSGMMLINLRLWRACNITVQAAAFVTDHPELIEYWDQDALNAVLKGSWLKLPEKFNYLTAYTANGATNPLIIHYTGKSKPWQYMDNHPFKKEYYKYLKRTRWKQYRPADRTIGNILRKHHLMPSLLERILSA